MGKKKELREIKAQTKAIADRSKDLHLENESRIAALLDAIEPSFAARIDEPPYRRYRRPKGCLRYEIFRGGSPFQ